MDERRDAFVDETNRHWGAANWRMNENEQISSENMLAPARNDRWREPRCAHDLIVSIPRSDTDKFYFRVTNESQEEHPRTSLNISDPLKRKGISIFCLSWNWKDIR